MSSKSVTFHLVLVYPLDLLSLLSLLNFIKVMRNHPTHDHLAILVSTIELLRISSFLFQFLFEGCLCLDLVLFLCGPRLFDLVKLHVEARLGVLAFTWTLLLLLLLASFNWSWFLCLLAIYILLTSFFLVLSSIVGHNCLVSWLWLE